MISCGTSIRPTARTRIEESCYQRRLLGFEMGRRPKNANLGDQRGFESESDSESEESWSKTLMCGDFGVGLLSCGQDACPFPRCNLPVSFDSEEWCRRWCKDGVSDGRPLSSVGGLGGGGKAAGALCASSITKS